MTVKKAAHVSDARAQEILDRAAAQGRKLRQDEKAKIQGPPILLAHSFEDEDIDPAGWWMSEKLDGVRAYWNGREFISRQGNVYHAPPNFIHLLPPHPLDGELWMGRRLFQKTVSAVKKQVPVDKEWADIQYKVFDAPSMGNAFEERMKYLRELLDYLKIPHVSFVEQTKCEGIKHLRKTLDAWVDLGAEGVMIRKPGSLYEPKRSHTILKAKPWKEAEASIIGHEPGTRRNEGRLGALLVKMPNGKTFRIGTGFSDEQRDSPPPIGAAITYRFTDTTDDGIPKCASFVGVRDYE